LRDPGFLPGKKALITGAARRLGRETSLLLARQGVHICVHYNASKGPAEDLCMELDEMGVQAVPLAADLGDHAAVENLFGEAWEAMDGLDFLVNNASIFPPERLDEMDLSRLIENVLVNAWAPFLLTRSFWRRVRGTEGRGSVVNLLDTRLIGGDLGHASYHLSKAMLRELTVLTALEFAPELRVNGVAPGAVLPPDGENEDYLASLTRELPLKRRGYPRDIAAATAYLLGASFVTGQVVFVDGGRHIRLGGGT